MALGGGAKTALHILGPILVLGAMAGLWFVRDHLGMTAALWVFGMVWATDIGAYFAGRAFGGARLAPTISPSKNWSGLIGGMENGRAACRERVCQSVGISVVAVTLKKKKNT